MFSKFFGAIKRAGKRIGEFQARLLMSFFYFVVLGPIALISRRGSYVREWLNHEIGWRDAPERSGATEQAKKQY
jgi:hypothetical protein